MLSSDSVFVKFEILLELDERWNGKLKISRCIAPCGRKPVTGRTAVRRRSESIGDTSFLVFTRKEISNGQFIKADLSIILTG